MNQRPQQHALFRIKLISISIAIFSCIVLGASMIGKGIRYWEIPHSNVLYQALSIAALALTARFCFALWYKNTGDKNHQDSQRSYARFARWALTLSLLDIAMSFGLGHLTGQSYLGEDCTGLLFAELFMLFLLYGAWRFYSERLRQYCEKIVNKRQQDT